MKLILAIVAPASLLRRVQILIHPDLEIQQFGPLRIGHARDVDIRTRQRSRYVLHIEKKKS